MRLQAGYYVATGISPLVSRRAFEAVTGRKQDWWLVQMVGLLAATNGIAIWIGSTKSQPSRETVALAQLSAVSFGVIDVVYALRRRISPVYLLDALFEAAVFLAIYRSCHPE
ncbi:MAG: hypothetical protein JOZ62_13640 [Acidobacteriaceae bacterium]|nr:hypothetical protein [Acidobacteriaceae bacterium]